MLIAATVAGAQPAQPTSWKLDKVEAPNARRFTPEQILTMSGLQLGQTVGLDAVDAAMARLSATGYFTSTGLSESNATRLRQAWKLREGAVYNASYLDEYMRVWLPPEEPLRARLQNMLVKLDRQRLGVDVNFIFK